jgi:hypothetical protein
MRGSFFHPGFAARDRKEREKKTCVMPVIHLPDEPARFPEPLSLRSLRSFAANHFPFQVHRLSTGVGGRVPPLHAARRFQLLH